jgi:hypothetical protein
MRRDADRDTGGLALLSMRQLADANFTSTISPELLSVYQSIAQWISSYLMSTHPELGRPGDVCPFTAQAYRLDTIRIGVCDATGSDVSIITSRMRPCFQHLALIPCAESMQHFRTIIVGFPKLEEAKGFEALKIAQAKLKIYSLARGLMIGRFYAGANDPGLWNADFRPMRSPIPLLAIRHLVENDVSFVIRHPLLLPTYLWKYSRAAPKRLLAHLLQRR